MLKTRKAPLDESSKDRTDRWNSMNGKQLPKAKEKEILIMMGYFTANYTSFFGVFFIKQTLCTF